MQRHALRSLLSVLLVVLLAGVAAAGTTGKIRGRVTDKSTGEALVGASIVLETTTMGASADVNGEFTVLGVPPGAYTVRAAFVGYKALVIRNVRVTVDLTTEVNFQLESQAIPGPTIEIVVQAPLVNKSATNQVNTMTAEKIEQLPVRNIQGVFALAPGVVSQGGNYYVRGGRLEETAFYVDGVLVNNPINGQLTLNVINNAIEEVQTQIGGMTAQYGNAMSGLVNTTTKVGGPKYSGSLEVITDQLGGQTSKNIFGAYSYGQSEYVATLGGPIIPGDERFRFFVAGQRVFNRSSASFTDGLKPPSAVDSNAITGADWVVLNADSVGGTRTAAAGSTGHRGYLANLLNNNSFDGGRNLGGVDRDSYSLSGNLYADFGTANVKVGGTYNSSRSIGAYGRGFGIVAPAAGAARGTRTEATDMSLYAKLTHFLNPTTYYTLQGNYYGYKTQTADQIMWDDIEHYGDPKVNSVLVGPSQNPPNWTIYSFSTAWPGAVANTYNKAQRSNWGLRLDFTHQFGQVLDLRAGGEFNQYTIRTYGINPLNIYLARRNKPTASDWTIYNDAGVTTYGYDIYGNEFAGGSFTDRSGYTVDLSQEGPRHPVFLGGYVQSKFEFEDLIINAGLRYDYFDPGAPQYADPLAIAIDTYAGVPVIADTAYKASREKYSQVSPRLGFSFPVADRTVFHATYGKFMQMGRLSDLYTSRMTAAFFFTSVFAYQQPNPNLKPERTTDYEVGFRQQIADEASFDLSFYYKDTKDLHVIRVVYPNAGQAYYTTVNGDYGTSKGLTLTFTMRRTSRIAMNANYTLSSSTATGSSSGTHFDIAWQDNSYNGKAYFPVIPAPTDFDRTHVGNVNLDYRFDKDDGPTLFGAKFLERVGLNFLFSFSSGKRYTQSVVTGAFGFSATNAPPAQGGMNASEGPWIYQLDMKLDKSFTLIGNLDLNIYLWITNLFNTKNVMNGVYSGTGSPTEDGWLTTSTGQTWANTNGPAAVADYRWLEENMGFYGPPRQVRLGARLAF